MSSSRNDRGRDIKKLKNDRGDTVHSKEQSRAPQNGKSGAETKKRDLLESKFFKDGTQGPQNGIIATGTKTREILQSKYFKDLHGVGKKVKENFEEETFSDDPDFTNFPSQYNVPVKKSPVKELKGNKLLPAAQTEASCPRSKISPSKNSGSSNSSAADRRIRRNIGIRMRQRRVGREQEEETEEREVWKKATSEISSPRKSVSTESSGSDSRIRRDIEIEMEQRRLHRRREDEVEKREEWVKNKGGPSSKSSRTSSPSTTTSGASERIRHDIEVMNEQRRVNRQRIDDTEVREEWVRSGSESPSLRATRSSSRSSSNSETSHTSERNNRMQRKQLRYNKLREEEHGEQDEWAKKRLEKTRVCPKNFGWGRYVEPKFGDQERLEGYRCYGGEHLITHSMLSRGLGEVFTITKEASLWARARGRPSDWDGLRGFQGVRWEDRGDEGKNGLPRAKGGREIHVKKRRGQRSSKNPDGWPSDFPSFG